MTRAIPESHYQFLPVPLALAGPSHGFVQVYSQRWWSVCPRRGLRFYSPITASGRRQDKGLGSPQCNASPAVMHRHLYDGDAVQYFERVFVPINLGDWT
jgi:hypothetical protein